MKVAQVSTLLWLGLSMTSPVHARNDEQFNYHKTDGRDYGPEDWGKVSCDDLDKCVSQITIQSKGVCVSSA